MMAKSGVAHASVSRPGGVSTPDPYTQERKHGSTIRCSPRLPRVLHRTLDIVRGRAPKEAQLSQEHILSLVIGNPSAPVRIGRMAGEHENIDTTDQEKVPSREELERPRSMEAIEIAPDHGGEAVKQDDSDGVVNWTLKNLLATFSLSALYVGAFYGDRAPYPIRSEADILPSS